MDKDSRIIMEKDSRIKHILRNLATNVFMQDLDYANYEVSFTTVFYRTAYSYRCCRCAYAHEYLEYIQDNGSIDEPLYEQMVANVVNGQCQHVENTPKHFLRDTGLYGIHFAAACSTLDAFLQAKRMTYTTLIFRANLWNIAVAKKNECSMTIFLDATKQEFVYHNVEHLCVVKSERHEEAMNIRELTLLEQCVQNRSLPLVKLLFSLDTGVPAGLESSLRIVFENNLQELQKIFLNLVRECSEKGKLIHTLNCAELAIVYNKPTELEAILKTIPHGKRNFGLWLNDTCDALQRNDCQKVLNKLNTFPACNKPASERMAKFLHLLENFHDVEKDKIIAAFKADKECHSLFLKQYSGSGPVSFSRIFKDTRQKRRDPRVIRAFYDLGLDINAVDFNRTALTYFLNGISSSDEDDRFVREILTILIQENPDVGLNDTAVDAGIVFDRKLAKKHFKTAAMRGEYICDGKEHLLHDKHVFALNFIGPYLIECGFRAKTPFRFEDVEEQALHQEELAYLQQCVAVPRTLMLRCRDVLRKHFTGRKLRAFLHVKQLPKRLEKFILIKS